MKIVIKLLLAVFLGLFCNTEVFASEGFAQLYLLKKTDADTVSGIMHDFLKSQGYKVLGARNMYVVPQNVDPMVPKYYVLLFKQNKNDCYYYNCQAYESRPEPQSLSAQSVSSWLSYVWPRP